MKCSTHKAEAVAVCAYCGRAVCPTCGQSVLAGATGGSTVAPPARIVCSEACGAALTQTEARFAQLSTTAQQLLRQSQRNARASAFYCYLGCGLSGSAAILAWFILPSDFLIYFTSACAVVLLVSGIWYSRAARKESA
ncbi:MAG: hypothetical protein ACREIC_14775 [Limisphaerales bacterium]